MFNYLCNGSFISTHPIAAAAYHKGWARNGAIVSGASQYGIPVILIIMELQKCRPHVLVALFLFRSGSFHFKDQYADWGFDTKSCKNNAPVLYC
jgi:hypothetical protein